MNTTSLEMVLEGLQTSLHRASSSMQENTESLADSNLQLASAINELVQLAREGMAESQRMNAEMKATSPTGEPRLRLEFVIPARYQEDIWKRNFEELTSKFTYVDEISPYIQGGHFHPTASTCYNETVVKVVQEVIKNK